MNNNFIRILPLTKFNAPARGAKVKVIQNSRAQIRFIDSGSGYLCQMEPVAHFGLGKNKNVIKVIVEWPDGNKKEILNPIPNKTIKVLYWYLKSQIINVLLGPKDLGIHALQIHNAVVVWRAWVGIISTRETSLEVIASEVFNDTD